MIFPELLEQVRHFRRHLLLWNPLFLVIKRLLFFANKCLLFVAINRRFASCQARRARSCATVISGSHNSIALVMTRRQISDTSDIRVTLVAKAKPVGFYQAVHTTHVTGQQPTHEQDALGDSDDGLAHFLQQCTAFLGGAGLHRSRYS